MLPEPGVGDPVSPAGIRRGANRVLPSSWGTSVIRLPCSNPTPAGLLASDHCDTAAWPLVCKKQRLPRKVFRSSIAWLPGSLFTLRGVSCLSTTQNSLPVAGQALPDGISTRKVPLKGFKVADYISFPFPKLAWRNCIDRGGLRCELTDFGLLHLRAMSIQFLDCVRMAVADFSVANLETMSGRSILNLVVSTSSKQSNGWPEKPNDRMSGCFHRCGTE